MFRFEPRSSGSSGTPPSGTPQPNHHYRLTALPNDPRFGEQWGLNATGQSVQGLTATPDADIDAPEAWDLTKGARSVIAAVADSGVAYDHPELSPNLWLNPGERGRGRESNGRDDDRNGLVDDWRGWDFADKDNDLRDLNGHGTHVAGIVGARARQRHRHRRGELGREPDAVARGLRERRRD